MAPSKVVKVKIAHAESLQDTLNSIAAEGYVYGSLTPFFGTSGGSPLFPTRNGVYVDWAILRMDPAQTGGLYHVWVVPNRRSNNLDELTTNLHTLVEAEAWSGYQLIDTVPLNGFKTELPGPGTFGLVCIFSRPPGTRTPLTLSAASMKPVRHADSDTVPCPVSGCPTIVPRMTRGTDLDSPEDEIEDYLCPDHQIYISPSTFSYKEPLQSIIWHDHEDTQALGKLRTLPGGKRTWSRMNRERDEDSVTWNVIRGLEREGVLRAILNKALTGAFYSTLDDVEKVIYWSVDIEAADIWGPLTIARQALGETRGYSEPDIIIICQNAVVILEVKFTSPAVTAKTQVPSYYVESNRWSRVFSAQPEAVLKNCGYELMRYFLLAHELQTITGKPCRVVTLTMKDAEPGLYGAVTQSLGCHSTYAHIDWNFFAAAIPAESIRTKLIRRYLASKSAGYQNGSLVRLIK